MFLSSIEDKRKLSLFEQSFIHNNNKKLASKQKFNNNIRSLTIVLKYFLKVKNNITKINIKVEENVDIKNSNYFKSYFRQSNNLRFTKTKLLITKLNFFLNYSLLYC